MNPIADKQRPAAPRDWTLGRPVGAMSLHLWIVGVCLVGLAGCGSSNLPLAVDAVSAPAPVILPAGSGTTTVGKVSFTAMAANVGNNNLNCNDQVFKLCLQAVEDRIGARLKSLQADVLGITEVLPPDRCHSSDASSMSPFNVCNHPQTVPQVMRILGPGYAVACASPIPWDCLAVKTSVGHIEGCDVPASGGYCGAMLPARPVNESCDSGFQVFSGRVVVRGKPLTVVVAHPNSSDVPCRDAAIKDFFAQIPTDRDALVLGDMNLDPYNRSEASVDTWKLNVGAGKRFTYFSGIAEHNPPYITEVITQSDQQDPTGQVTTSVAIDQNSNVAGVIDHVVGTAGLSGLCQTLGQAPNTTRLDGGGGCDHRALLCSVEAQQP